MRGTQTGKMWYYYILNFRTGFKGLQVFVALLIHLCPQITIMVKMAAWLRAPLSFVVTKGSDCPFTHIHTPAHLTKCPSSVLHVQKRALALE